MPRRNPGMMGSIAPNTNTESRLFDSTAIRANMTLANGQLAWMSPQESAWFSFTASSHMDDDDEVDMWLSKATTTVRDALARSKFYNVIHEFYLDRGGFGTACMFVEEDGSGTGKLNFKLWSVGTFTIDENHSGDIDTVFREFELTARQATQKFGEKVSKEIKDAMKKPETCDRKFKFVHAIYPREDADRDMGKMGGQNMPIASVYFEDTAKYLNKVGGYEEMPAFVSRYLEWGTGLGHLYGWCPAFAALPDARQANFLQEMMDALAEKKAFPPILAPAELEGEIEIEAGGITYHSKDMIGGKDRMPQEWNLAGDYNIGKDRIDVRQQAINDAFHVDLFQMFAELDKQMTAREVAARSQEKLIQFSPTFARLTTEVFEPLLNSAFSIMLRAGLLGTPPQSLIQDQGDGTGIVEVPVIEYNSRIAMALRALPAIATLDTFENVANVAQLVPDVLDLFDWDGAIKSVAISSGFPPEFIRSKSQVENIREQRAEQLAQAQQQEQQIAAAGALKDVGSIPGDSAVGEMVEGEFANARDQAQGI